MGSKHPISLRLKTKQNWVSTSYHFYTGNELYTYYGLDKMALNVIKHYFQFAILSKPKFNKDSNKIVISFYYFLNLPMSKIKIPSRQSRINISSLQKSLPPAIKFNSLILKLSNLYGKPVELRPVRIHYPYLNSSILAQYIAFNIKKGKFNMITRNLFKKAKLVKPPLNTKGNNLDNIKDLIKYSSIRLDPMYLSGIKIVISGRLSNRKAASRTRVVRKSIGTLSLNSNNSLIDANKFSFKGKNGAITVKVWLSSSMTSNNQVSNLNRSFSSSIMNTPLVQNTGILKGGVNNLTNPIIRSYSTSINNSWTASRSFSTFVDSSTNKNESLNITPVIFYENAFIDKSRILKENKNLSGVYMWKHKET